MAVSNPQGLPSIPPSPRPGPFNLYPKNTNSEDAHLHATLQRIDQLANEDVEMQAPLSEHSVFFVLDTNILLHHFDVLTQFLDDVERQALPVIVVIPGVVIYELDGQKNRNGLGWFARRASAWLLKKVKERKSVKGQANEETCKASKNWKVRALGEDFGSRVNDGLILDCCLYFRRGRQTFLCSADNNLCIESDTEGIPTISPTKNWSSRDIAWVIFGHLGIDLNNFGAYRTSYKAPIGPVPTDLQVNDDHVDDDAAQADDDNDMMIDDDASMAEVLHPSHALDLLHIQVIDHFTTLLVELVGRVGGPKAHSAPSGEGASASRYAPQQSQKRHYSKWDISDSVEYLNSMRWVAPTSPRVGVFLSKPYTCRGARRGQDWSRRDWEVGLGALANIGDMWDEGSIRESLDVLRGHVEGIFATRMRPTGI